MGNIKHSQNFLYNPDLINRLIKKSSIKSGDLVYEIGPGRGIITFELAKYARSVIAIEADDKLYTELKDKTKGIKNIILHKEDFLRYPLTENTYKVFSNIPFNLTADIVRKLIDAPVAPLDTYLIVQFEAAKKFAGFPYGKETLFSLIHKPWFAFDIIHKFNRSDFRPIPNVNTVFLRIEKLSKALVEPRYARIYQDFIAFGFTSFKPTLKKGYKNIFGHVQFFKLADNLKFNATAKPTDLNFEQWLGMFNYFLVGVEPHRQQKILGSMDRLNKQQKNLSKIHRTRTAKNWKRNEN